MDPLMRRQLAGTATLVVVVLLAALLFSPHRTVEQFRHLASDPISFGLALVALYAVRPLFAWPISPISALVGYVLGFAYGIPVALVGATATCLLPFLAVRYVDVSGGLFGRFNDAGERIVSVTGESRGVLAARLSPLPADPVSYGAGFADVSTRAFLVGTFVGEIPWVIVEVMAGVSLRKVSEQGLGAGVYVLLAAAAISVLLVAGPAYRHVRAGQPS
jgi:uncharacterized membrane protein YdjX (TVP38/TMEM64 family)